jgi:hypothetical protein
MAAPRPRRKGREACWRDAPQPRNVMTPMQAGMADIDIDTDLYETDFAAWADRQAALARGGHANRLDLDHIAEELEGLSSRERRELRRRLALLIQHLLKWCYQPELRSNSWSTTILIQRSDIDEMLADSPSLRGLLPSMLPASFRLGRQWAMRETGLLQLPEPCPWTLESILSNEFLPDEPLRQD